METTLFARFPDKGRRKYSFHHLAVDHFLCGLYLTPHRKNRRESEVKASSLLWNNNKKEWKEVPMAMGSKVLEPINNE